MKDEKFGKSHYNHPDYTVTRDGRVYSWKSGQPVQMAGHRTTDGKMVYGLDGTLAAGHWLVMEIWGGDQTDNICQGRKIKHIDANGCNNDLDNLCYMTQAEYNEFRRWYKGFYNEILRLKQTGYR